MVIWLSDSCGWRWWLAKFCCDSTARSWRSVWNSLSQKLDLAHVLKHKAWHTLQCNFSPNDGDSITCASATGSLGFHSSCPPAAMCILSFPQVCAISMYKSTVWPVFFVSDVCQGRLCPVRAHMKFQMSLQRRFLCRMKLHVLWKLHQLSKGTARTWQQAAMWHTTESF